MKLSSSNKLEKKKKGGLNFSIFILFNYIDLIKVDQTDEKWTMNKKCIEIRDIMTTKLILRIRFYSHQNDKRFYSHQNDETISDILVNLLKR